MLQFDIWLGYTYADYEQYAPRKMPRLVDKNTDKWTNDMQVTAETELNAKLLKSWKRLCTAKSYHFLEPTNASQTWKIKEDPQKGWSVCTPFRFDVLIGKARDITLPDTPIGVPLTGLTPVFLDFLETRQLLRVPFRYDSALLRDAVNIVSNAICREIQWFSWAYPMLIPR